MTHDRASRIAARDGGGRTLDNRNVVKAVSIHSKSVFQSDVMTARKVRVNARRFMNRRGRENPFLLVAIETVRVECAKKEGERGSHARFLRVVFLLCTKQ